jgi:hypothetical protein
MCTPLQPVGPANIYASLGDWLQLLGFRVQEEHGAGIMWMLGCWVAPTGQRFKLEYTWGPGQPGHATCALWVERGLACHMLVKPEATLTLLEAQQLLVANLEFRAVYTAACSDVALAY